MCRPIAGTKPIFKVGHTLFAAYTLQVLMKIRDSKPPTLEPTTDASRYFHDFLRAALVKDPELRPTARQLLDFDSCDWIDSAERTPLATLLAEQAALTQAGGGGGGAADQEGRGTNDTGGDTVLLPGGGGTDSDKTESLDKGGTASGTDSGGTEGGTQLLDKGGGGGTTAT